ncbi:MAG: hypothetical protein HAW60_06190 [Bdellovibrionales bacterium]|nr:hypothetical protein [Bdellovibrionales bacterium]
MRKTIVKHHSGVKYQVLHFHQDTFHDIVKIVGKENIISGHYGDITTVHDQRKKGIVLTFKSHHEKEEPFVARAGDFIVRQIPLKSKVNIAMTAKDFTIMFPNHKMF